MSNFILAGLFTEGTTDVRFLSSVVERTLVDVVFDCAGEFETKLVVIMINKSGLKLQDLLLISLVLCFYSFILIPMLQQMN